MQRRWTWPSTAPCRLRGPPLNGLGGRKAPDANPTSAPGHWRHAPTPTMGHQRGYACAPATSFANRAQARAHPRWWGFGSPRFASANLDRPTAAPLSGCVASPTPRHRPTAPGRPCPAMAPHVQALPAATNPQSPKPPRPSSPSTCPAPKENAPRHKTPVGRGKSSQAGGPAQLKSGSKSIRCA